MHDCCFTYDDNWFRYRAVAIIIEGTEILLATNNYYLYSIGGAVQMNETAEDAVVREVFEESGLKYEIDKFVGVHENFFRDKKIGDYNCHELALYFLMKPQGKQDPLGDRESVWIPISELKNYKKHIDFIDAYLSSNNDFLHIVTID